MKMSTYIFIFYTELVISGYFVYEILKYKGSFSSFWQSWVNGLIMFTIWLCLGPSHFLSMWLELIFQTAGYIDFMWYVTCLTIVYDADNNFERRFRSVIDWLRVVYVTLLSIVLKLCFRQTVYSCHTDVYYQCCDI